MRTHPETVMPQPSPAIALLHLEAKAADADQVHAHLTAAGLGVDVRRVATRADFVAALEAHRYDLILAAYVLPDFDGLAALEVARAKAPETPFVFVSGMLGEEAAIEALKRGATDYVLKQRLERLVPAVQRALAEAHERAERRRAESALGESEERFRLIVENAHDHAMFTTDLEGRVTTWNTGAERLLGYAEAEILGRDAAILFTPEDRARGVPAAEMQQALHTGRGEDERWHLRKDGSRFWASGSTVPLRGGDGPPRGFLKIFRDRTEHRRAEEELHEASRRKDDFLAMLAHELRNPLAPIRNGLHVLDMCAGKDATVQRVREMMGRQIQHMARLIEDLLEVSRLTRGKITLQRTRLDLARLVRLEVEDRRGGLEGAGLTVRVQAPETPVWVQGDATRLAQLLDNLLDNAAKFSQAGDEVSVRVLTQEAEREAVVVVRDTGSGIEPGLLPRVFESFTQADRSPDRSKGGLGLGLALVKGLVELHGGRIEAASDGPGRGARFTLWLPLEGEPAALVERPSPPAEGKKPLRILVVEDNRDAAESLRMLLSLCGYEVTVAHTGPGGVAAALKTRPDVVLCDIGLPGMDGLAVADALRRSPVTAETRLIAVTGYGQEDDRRRALEAGFDEHLVKPVDPEQLLGQLETGRA